MWDPGFPVARSVAAVLPGYHRRFSIFSNGSYGRPDSPGLALGLHPGGSCRARALCVNPAHAEETIVYLDRRESAYLRRQVMVTLDDGTSQRATTYVINPQHPRYAGQLTDHETAHFISTGSGTKGTSLAYLEKTVQELENQGVRRSTMHSLLRNVRKFAAENGS
jgi:glutathione-specific gamma-glutamylcyclotransferase